MAENSKIEWTDHTFNPWIGCQKVGPGCDHCYAESMMDTHLRQVEWGPGKERKRTSEANWEKPRRWARQANAFGEEHGRRQRVFCASLADVFDNAVPAEWRLDLLKLIDETPELDWLLLTKRIGNVRPMLAEAGIARTAPDNIYLGATVVNQEEADRDIPKLLDAPFRKRFLSMEPLLGPVDLDTIWLRRDGQRATELSNRLGDYVQPLRGNFTNSPKIDWVIAGGESGRGARPMHPDWPRSLRDQCAAAGTPFLFKQWGEWAPHEIRPGGDLGGDIRSGRVCLVNPSGRSIFEQSELTGRGGEPGARYMVKAGKRNAGRLLDGQTHDGFPPEMMPESDG